MTNLEFLIMFVISWVIGAIVWRCVIKTQLTRLVRWLGFMVEE